MIKYASFEIERRSTCVSIQDNNQGYIPGVFLFSKIILSKPGWGTLTIL